jgi:hypothetical protein
LPHKPPSAGDTSLSAAAPPNGHESKKNTHAPKNSIRSTSTAISGPPR